MITSHRSSAGLLSIVFACEFLWSACAIGGDEASLLKKHVEFLQNHLQDADPFNKANALRALAAYDLPAQMERVRKAVHSSTDIVQHVGLYYMRGHARHGDLQEIKALVVAIGPKANKNDAGYDSVTEGLAVEVLLASDDPMMRAFANQHLRTLVQSRDVPLTRFSVMVDVAGEYGLKELLPLIRDGVAMRSENKEKRPMVSLAKLGDKEGIQCVKRGVTSGASDVNLWWSLSADSKAREATGIELKDLRTVVSAHSFESETEKKRLLAYLGDHEGLLAFIDALSPGEPLGDETNTILIDAAKVGDKRYVKSLDALFDKSTDVRLRVSCSAAIVEILARCRTAVDRGK